LSTTRTDSFSELPELDSGQFQSAISSLKYVPLGSVCTIVNGGTPDTKNPNFWGGSNSWITPAEMGKTSSREVSKTVRSISDDGLRHAADLLPVSSVILSTRAPIGHLVINTVPMSFNQGCRGLIPSPELHYLYLYYFLLHSKRLLNSLGTGTTFAELSTSSLKSVLIPLPSYAEQVKIVSELENFERIAGRLGEVFIQEERVCSELISSMQQSVFASVPTKSPKFLPDISKNLDSRRKPVTKNVRVAGSVPYYGASGIVDYVETHIFDEQLLLVSEDGANLLARSTPIAFSVEGPAWVNNHAHVLSFESQITQTYVEYFLNSLNLAPWITGAAQPKLNQAALNSIPIRIPQSLDEQMLIVGKLQSVSNEVSRLKGTIGDKRNALNELFAAFVASKMGVLN
jgi:restriction endonuclease S subunit